MDTGHRFVGKRRWDDALQKHTDRDAWAEAECVRQQSVANKNTPHMIAEPPQHAKRRDGGGSEGA